PRPAPPSSPETRSLAAVPRALPAAQAWASNSRPSFPGALISPAGEHAPSSAPPPVDPLAAPVTDPSPPLPEEQAIGRLLPADPSPEPVPVPRRNSPRPRTEPEQGPVATGDTAPSPAQTDPLPSPGDRDARPFHGQTGPE